MKRFSPGEKRAHIDLKNQHSQVNQEIYLENQDFLLGNPDDLLSKDGKKIQNIKKNKPVEN